MGCVVPRVRSFPPVAVPTPLRLDSTKPLNLTLDRHRRRTLICAPTRRTRSTACPPEPSPTPGQAARPRAPCTASEDPPKSRKRSCVSPRSLSPGSPGAHSHEGRELRSAAKSIAPVVDARPPAVDPAVSPRGQLGDGCGWSGNHRGVAWCAGMGTLADSRSLAASCYRRARVAHGPHGRQPGRNQRQSQLDLV